MLPPESGARRGWGRVDPIPVRTRWGVDPMPAGLIPRAGGSTRRQEGVESGPFSGSGLRWERWDPGFPRRVLPARFPAPISESMSVCRPMCQGPGPMSLMFSEIGVENRAGMFPSGARVQHRSPACGGGGWWRLPALGDGWCWGVVLRHGIITSRHGATRWWC